MARDEALLNRVGDGSSAPTLRLYQWNPPTISLGYFQKYADYESLDPPAGNLDVVRRPTGGGAILHDLELTYSITLPATHALLTHGPNHLYEIAHDVVIDALHAIDVTTNRDGDTDDSSPTRGPFFCFARRHKFDVLLGSDKLAGSAQRRTRSAVLQHGSIVLANRYAQQPTAIVARDCDATLAHLRTEFVRRFAERAGLPCETGEWTPEELAAATELVPKHGGDAWVKRT
jgi:lipoate-protein ligase A